MLDEVRVEVVVGEEEEEEEEEDCFDLDDGDLEGALDELLDELLEVLEVVLEWFEDVVINCIILGCW